MYIYLELETSLLVLVGGNDELHIPLSLLGIDWYALVDEGPVYGDPITPEELISIAEFFNMNSEEFLGKLVREIKIMGVRKT